MICLMPATKPETSLLAKSKLKFLDEYAILPAQFENPRPEACGLKAEKF